MPLAAAIYDLDGLLIDSEPSWVEAEVEVFGALGVPLNPELCRETTGLRMDEAVAHWAARFPWAGPSRAEVAARIVSRVSELLVARGALKPGVRESLTVVRGAGLRCGLASSSPLVLIRAVLARFELTGAFEVTASAEREPFGKPHPGVYLTAAAALGVPPATCVALEDSVNGVRSAKAAGMRCIAVPDHPGAVDSRLAVADAVVPSLLDVTPELLRTLAA